MILVRKVIEFLIRIKWLAILLVLGFVLGVGISTFYRGAISSKQRTDLTVYLIAGEMVADGRANNIYEIENMRGWHYNYPPILAILLAPVSKWPLAATVPLAYLLSMACLAGTIALSMRFPDSARPAKTDLQGHASVPETWGSRPAKTDLQGHASVPETLGSRPAKTDLQGHASVPETLGCRPAPWQIALALLLSLPILLNTFTRGQFGIITLFFMAAVFYSYIKEQKILTGILLALGIALKISPLAFLVFFFLMKREWKILASTALGFALFFFLLPSLAIGFEQNWELLKVWKDLMSVSQSQTAYQHYLWGELFTPFAEDNQSLYAVITRFVWHSQAHFIRRYSSLVRYITLGAGILLLALPFLRARKGSSSPVQDPLRSLAEFSLFPMVMLFASPVTQIHHYTVVYFLFIATLMMMERAPHGAWTQKFLGISLWICALSLTLGMIFPWVSYWGIPLWGSLVLWLAVLVSLKRGTS